MRTCRHTSSLLTQYSSGEMIVDYSTNAAMDAFHEPQKYPLSGKVAAVNGATRGPGLGLVQSLARAGADVAMIYHTDTNAARKAMEIAKEWNVRVVAFPSDVNSSKEIAQTLEHISNTFGNGHLDIIVANAGIYAMVSALDAAKETWFINESHCDGVKRVAQAAGSIFLRQGHGHLVIVTPTHSLLNDSFTNVPTALHASHAAGEELTVQLSAKWAGFARVTYLSSGCETIWRHLP